MGKYNWKEENIQNTLNDKRKVDSLFTELNHKVDTETSNLLDRNITFREFKKSFRYDFITLGRIDTDMVEYTFNLYSKVKPSEIMSIELPKHELDDEELINYIIEFIESLNNKEMLKELKEIINPDNHYLKIEKKEDNIMSSLIQGRVIKSDNSKDSFGSFYKKGTDEDVVILAHEIGHMLSHRLFYDKFNTYMKYFLTEVESYFFELLMGEYLGEKYNFTKQALCFRANRLAKIIENAWDIHVQYLMNCYFFNVNFKEVNDILQLEQSNFIVEKKDFNKFTNVSLLYKSKMINSYLVALELFKQYFEDKEKCLKTFKKLYASKQQDYQKLLNNYNLNYLQNDESFNIMVSEVKSLKKILGE